LPRKTKLLAVIYQVGRDPLRKGFLDQGRVDWQMPRTGNELKAKTQKGGGKKDISSSSNLKGHSKIIARSRKGQGEYRGENCTGKSTRRG